MSSKAKKTYIVSRKMCLVVGGETYQKGDEIKLTAEQAAAFEGRYVIAKIAKKKKAGKVKTTDGEDLPDDGAR